jgi:hypothetical protein
VRTSDYYCYNCGKKLQEKPLSTNVVTQLGIYVGSILLAPMGLVWGIRYLRQPSTTAKIIGVVAIGLTVATLVIASKLVTSYITAVNEQVTKQLNGMQGF